MGKSLRIKSRFLSVPPSRSHCASGASLLIGIQWYYKRTTVFKGRGRRRETERERGMAPV